MRVAWPADVVRFQQWSLGARCFYQVDSGLASDVTGYTGPKCLLMSAYEAAPDRSLNVPRSLISRAA